MYIQKKKYRSQFLTFLDVLDTLSHNSSLLISELSRVCNISHPVTAHIITKAISANLIIEKNHDNHRVYSLTDDGLKLLTHMNSIHSHFKLIGLESII